MRYLISLYLLQERGSYKLASKMAANEPTREQERNWEESNVEGEIHNRFFFSALVYFDSVFFLAFFS